MSGSFPPDCQLDVWESQAGHSPGSLKGLEFVYDCSISLICFANIPITFQTDVPVMPMEGLFIMDTPCLSMGKKIL